MDPGEDEWTAALRETQEEAGLDAKDLEIHKEFCHVMNYEANKHPKRVTYWLAQLKNDGLEVKISMEHQKFAWADLGEAIGLAKYPEIEKMLIAADEYIAKNLSWWRSYIEIVITLNKCLYFEK